MIQDANSQQVEEADTPIELRALALKALKFWAWAASEDPDILANLLGGSDCPANRTMLAKIFQNLGRTPE